jgi:hypothetical protein
LLNDHRIWLTVASITLNVLKDQSSYDASKGTLLSLSPCKGRVQKADCGQ